VSTPVRRWRFPATSQYIAHARYVVAAHARGLGADEASVALAVSEAFTSAVVHAAPGGACPGDVEVVVVRHPDALEVCVCDDAPCAEHGNGGEMDGELGLRMIEQVTTALELTHGPQGGTQLRMSFPVT
jgi:anti-sigma regulatory factor (Ser/Thr protein kinase)